MSRHQATFEIQSRTDAHAARLLVERVYDAIREELSRSGGSESDQTLAELASLRDAVRDPSPGRLTIVYESREDGFEN